MRVFYILVATSIAASATAQSVVIPDAPSCARCAVTARRIMTLGTTDGPGSIAETPRVAVDSRNRYWVITGTELPMVFDSSGRFLASVGAKGSGPGEFQRVLDAVSVGDSMVLFDSGLKRATVVGPDLRSVRTIPAPDIARTNLVVEWPGNVWQNIQITRPPYAGIPLHRFSYATSPAQLLSSFGPDPAATGAEVGRPHFMMLSVASGERVWAADTRRYRLTLWTKEGAKLKTFERQPAWFPAPVFGSPGSKTAPPDPVTRAIQEDSAGLVWVFTSVPSKTWAAAWEDSRKQILRGGEVITRGIAFEKLYSTMIEVIDPREGRVVARQLIDGYVAYALPGRRAATLSSDDDGFFRVGVLSLTLTGR